MIAQLEGTLVHIDIGFVILEVAGVGYKVHIPLSVESMPTQTGERLRLWTHLAVREDALDLYGFATQDEHNFFQLLLKVPGIGPKSALNIISIAPLGTLRQAVSESDFSYLTKVSGIGRKMAEKIVLELKDKMSLPTAGGPAGTLRAETDTLEALISLGYSRGESQDALRQVGAKGTVNERLTAALKILGNHQ